MNAPGRARGAARPTVLLAVLVVLLTGVVTACSGESSKGGAGTGWVATGPAGPTDGTGPHGSEGGGSAPPAESVAGATTSVVVLPTRPSTSPDVPETSDPFASAPAPDPTEPADMPGPPAGDCVDAAAGPATVELTVDDDHVRYANAIAPSCVRIHAAQQLTIRSTSVARATVDVGTDSYQLAPGAVVTTAALGSMYPIGAVFDVFVEELDLTVVVQVLP